MKLKINLTDEETVVANAASKLNLTAVKSNENATNTYNITFNDSDIYDLDDIIAAKKRDSDSSPLLLKVNTSDTNDIAVINSIVKMILTDYGIIYSDDSTTSNYFANIVYKVPSFYDVFSSYFDKYYAIYYNQKNQLSEGSISITTLIEKIHNVHDNVYTNVNSTSTAAYADVENKPKVEYEYGSIEDPTRAVMDLGIDEDRLKLKYEDVFYGEGVLLDDIATKLDQKFTVCNLKYDVSDCVYFECERNLLMKIIIPWDESKCKVKGRQRSL